VVLAAWWDFHLGDARRARLRKGLEMADMVIWVWMAPATTTASVVAGRSFPRSLELVGEEQQEDSRPFLKSGGLRSSGCQDPESPASPAIKESRNSTIKKSVLRKQRPRTCFPTPSQWAADCTLISMAASFALLEVQFARQMWLAKEQMNKL